MAHPPSSPGDSSDAAPTVAEPPVAVARLVPADGSAEFALPPAGQVRIGRSRTCEIVIQDPRVSRHHATLLCEVGNWWLVPGDAITNPVLVNGAPVDGHTRLAIGDVIGLGRQVALSLRSAGTDPTPAPTSGAGASDEQASAATAGAPQATAPGDATTTTSATRRPPRLVVLDTCQALVDAVPRGWTSTAQKWVVSVCDTTVIQPGEVYRLWEARNTAAHAAPGHVEQERMIEAAAIAGRIVEHLGSRGIDVKVYATSLPDAAE